MDLFNVYNAIYDCLPIGSNIKVTPPKNPEMKAITKLRNGLTGVIRVVVSE